MASIRTFLVQLLAEAIRLALAPEIRRWSERVDKMLTQTEFLLNETQATLAGMRELMGVLRATQGELLGLVGRVKKPEQGLLKGLKEAIFHE